MVNAITKDTIRIEYDPQLLGVPVDEDGFVITRPANIQKALEKAWDRGLKKRRWRNKESEPDYMYYRGNQELILEMSYQQLADPVVILTIGLVE